MRKENWISWHLLFRAKTPEDEISYVGWSAVVKYIYNYIRYYRSIYWI